ncbi:MAG TPA: glycosyltransferase, partial [Planctomycetaceae bacterium]
MHLGLVCPEMTGHLNPSLALGRELARRGHRVSVFTAPRVRAKVERAGLEIVPVGEKEDAEGLTAAAVERLGTLSGAAALLYTGRLICRASEILLRDLPEAIRRSGVDGLIVDQVCPAGAVVAERAAMPYVVACNAIAVLDDPESPPPSLLWRYRPGRLGRLRNGVVRIVLPLVFDLAAGTRRSGVSPLMLFFESYRGLAVVAQQPAFFDLPRAALPDHFHYTGPWHEEGRDDD